MTVFKTNIWQEMYSASDNLEVIINLVLIRREHVFLAFPIVLLLTSLSNWERGASPAQSMPPPDESEPSEGEVIVCRLLEL